MSTTISGDTGITFPDDSTQSKAVSQATPFAVTASAIAGAELQLPEATANGVNYVAVKAPNTLAANTTFTLPAADGTSGQVLQTNGSGALAFSEVSLTAGVSGILPVANGGTGASTLAANNVLLGNGTSALQAVAPGTTGNLLTSNGTTWTSAAAPSSFPLTLVNTTTISSSTSFYEQTNLGSFSDYMLFIYFLNCANGNPSGYLIQDNDTQRTWTETNGQRAFVANNSGTSWTVGTDLNNRVWLNSGNISYFYMTMTGFGTNTLRWRSEYQSTDDSGNYGYQQGKSESSSLGARTFKGFRITFPAAATTGIIQLYRRG
jgi:hypothetical protein